MLAGRYAEARTAYKAGLAAEPSLPSLVENLRALEAHMAEGTTAAASLMSPFALAQGALRTVILFNAIMCVRACVRARGGGGLPLASAPALYACARPGARGRYLVPVFDGETSAGAYRRALLFVIGSQLLSLFLVRRD